MTSCSRVVYPYKKSLGTTKSAFGLVAESDIMNSWKHLVSEDLHIMCLKMKLSEYKAYFSFTLSQFSVSNRSYEDIL